MILNRAVNLVLGQYKRRVFAGSSEENVRAAHITLQQVTVPLPWLIRGIRRFYFNLRRKLGEKQAADKIKSLKNIEFLEVNRELHKISKTIVEEAKRTNAVIVLGKLKGIRKNIKGSRRMRLTINQ